MKKDLLLFAAFIFGVATTAGAAKNKAGERIDTLKARQLQEVQVISTRASKKAPLAFTNVSKNDIQAVNYGKDIPYLLALTPSITLTSDAGNGIGYTTLRVRGTDPSRVNITANGIPMNDAESSSLFWVNFSDFASSTQSIQIQRGVGTSTNGAGAFGATVNMLTDTILVPSHTLVLTYQAAAITLTRRLFASAQVLSTTTGVCRDDCPTSAARVISTVPQPSSTATSSRQATSATTPW